ncbi:MAG: hypothetical protein JWL95_2050 [Gemmatimonadetes bacterium]|nr:hypothetical protein [Gemmatimonadota bacterium]
MEVLIGFIGVLIGALLASLRSYTAEKGKNLATREDIAEITRRVEGVRTDYLSQLERVKAELGEAQVINRSQYELELTAYRDVWQALLPVHRAAAALRPELDSMLGEGETETSRKRLRLQAFAEPFNPFREVVWTHRPFYPAAVFDELSELLKLMRKEAIEYEVFDQSKREDYWERAVENAQSINSQVDKVCDTIRLRLSVARVA